jgi:hypothetical protein
MLTTRFDSSRPKHRCLLSPSLSSQPLLGYSSSAWMRSRTSCLSPFIRWCRPTILCSPSLAVSFFSHTATAVSCSCACAATFSRSLATTALACTTKQSVTTLPNRCHLINEQLKRPLACEPASVSPPWKTPGNYHRVPSQTLCPLSRLFKFRSWPLTRRGGVSTVPLPCLRR